MKTSSYFTFTLVVVAFLIIQGWMLQRMFVAPRVFTAKEATMLGDSSEIRAPTPGQIQHLLVKENDRVEQDQRLLDVVRMVHNPLTGEWRQENTAVFALHPGVVVDLAVRNGAYVTGEQALATIVDNSPNSLHVVAKIAVPPNDVMRIRPLMTAVVQAEFLNDGEPIDAMIQEISPVYDSQDETLSVRLQLFRYPDGIENLPLGLPVDAYVSQERRPDENIVSSIFHSFFPRSEAQAQ